MRYLTNSIFTLFVGYTRSAQDVYAVGYGSCPPLAANLADLASREGNGRPTRKFAIGAIPTSGSV